jgi:hypothetical protein
MEEITKSAIKHIVEQPEYQRKQAISILIASMLNDISNKQAKKLYDEVVDKLYKMDDQIKKIKDSYIAERFIEYTQKEYPSIYEEVIDFADSNKSFDDE